MSLSVLCVSFLARFFSIQGGDKLTLNLGNSSPEMKLINLDTSPTSKVAPPPPPPRTTSDPHYNKNENSNENNNDTSIPVSVTYFSSGLNGHGLERETIFADDHAATDAASIVRQHLNPFNSGSSKNPFLDSNGQVPTSDHKDDKDKSLDDLVEQKIQDLINANPFNSNGSKFNTIGRSNPFSNKNPFLNGSGTTTDSSKIAATSSGEDVNDSPDSSLEPDPHEVHNDDIEQMTNINKIVSSSRLRTLGLWQVLSFCKKQKYFGHNYLAMNFQFHAAFSMPIGTTILDTNW